MSGKRETEKIYSELVEAFFENSNYDFDKLEPYLVIFYDIPIENKIEVINRFMLLLYFYITDNEKKHFPTHNKVMSNDLYQKIKKERKICKDFLEIAEENPYLNDVVDKIKSFIIEQDKILNTKAVTKTQIKKYLGEINKKYQLKKSLETKELVDII